MPHSFELPTLRRSHWRRRSQGAGNSQQSEKKGLKTGFMWWEKGWLRDVRLDRISWEMKERVGSGWLHVSKRQWSGDRLGVKSTALVYWQLSVSWLCHLGWVTLFLRVSVCPFVKRSWQLLLFLPCWALMRVIRYLSWDNADGRALKAIKPVWFQRLAKGVTVLMTGTRTWEGGLLPERFWITQITRGKV